MAGKGHSSIGDVLSQLRDEFPDVTISKIRFLESQGLIDPERSPSGYRKFSGADVERLRFILREQKEHFLPLKVIKDRLAELDRSGGLPAPPDGGGAPTGGTTRARGEPAAEPALFEANRRASDAEAARVAAQAVADIDEVEELSPAASGVSLTRAELARAADLSDEELAQLEDYGLVTAAHTARDRVLFDEDALAVARVAGAFMRHGIEARHLRMYRAFADRESALFEQVLLPYRRQRNPEAQARIAAALEELATLGRRLRTALLRQSVRRVLGG